MLASTKLSLHTCMSLALTLFSFNSDHERMDRKRHKIVLVASIASEMPADVLPLRHRILSPCCVEPLTAALCRCWMLWSTPDSRRSHICDICWMRALLDRGSSVKASDFCRKAVTYTIGVFDDRRRCFGSCSRAHFHNAVDSCVNAFRKPSVYHIYRAQVDESKSSSIYL